MPRPIPLTRDEFVVFRALQTRWADNDIYAHLNNVTHHHLIDTAVNGWLIDLELLRLHAGPIIGVVVENKCSYLKEIAFPDQVAVGLRIGHLGKSSVRYDVALFANEDEQAAAQGYLFHTYVDRENRKPIALPPAWRAKLEEFVR